MGSLPDPFVLSDPLSLTAIADLGRPVTITYASEVCPVALRGYLTTYVNFCWGLGQTIGIGVIKSMLGRTDEWAYRIPFGLQVRRPLAPVLTTRLTLFYLSTVDVARPAFHRRLS